MSSAEDFRAFALSLAAVEEAIHFGMPSFKVKRKSFAGLEKDGVHGGVSVPLETGQAAVADDSAVYEEMWRGGTGPRNASSPSTTRAGDAVELTVHHGRVDLAVQVRGTATRQRSEAGWETVGVGSDHDIHVEQPDVVTALVREVLG